MEADLGLSEAACFGLQRRRLLRAKNMVDSGTIFGKFGGVVLGSRSTLSPSLQIVPRHHFLSEVAAVAAGRF